LDVFIYFFFYNCFVTYCNTVLFPKDKSNLKERAHWGDPGADGRIILRWIFREWDVGV
jgi:hypothetical protein